MTNLHIRRCVKSVCIRSFSDSYFPAFGVEKLRIRILFMRRELFMPNLRQPQLKKYFSISLQPISCSGYCEATHPCGECTCLDTCGSGYPYLCNCTSGKCHVKQTYISLEISYFGKLYNSSRWNTSSIFR